MVYSFFDPLRKLRSLGAFMILDHLARTLDLGLEHLYLGYWVKGRPKWITRRAFCLRSGSAWTVGAG